MKKTLLNALKHGSGTTLILLAMMLGVSLQAWGNYTYDLYIYCSNSPAYIYFWDSNNAAIGNSYPGTQWSNFSKTSIGNNWYKCQIASPTATYGVQVNQGDDKSKSSDQTGLSNSWIGINGNTDCQKYKTPSQYYLKSSFTDWETSDTGTSFDGFDEGNGANYHQHVLSANTYTYKIYSGGWYEPSYNNARGDGTVTVSGGGSNDFSFTITGADKLVTIFYDPGANVSFVNAVDACNNPTVVAGDYSSLTSSSVTIAATVTAALSDPCVISYVGVDVYTDQACTVSASVNKEVSYSGSNYSITGVNVSSLTPKTTYYYKTYAKRSSDNAKVYSSNVGSFTMPCLRGVSISSHPSGTEEKCLGSATDLSVTATSEIESPTYTYQWYYNSTNDSKEGAMAIPGATSNSYKPGVVGEYYYYCSVGAEGGYCEAPSNYSEKITIKGVPVISVSQSSVTNYVPVTLTATGAESITWSITSGEGGYLYKEGSTSAMFKGNVGTGSDVTYTIQGTANGCSGTATVKVSRNSADSCQ